MSFLRLFLVSAFLMAASIFLDALPEANSQVNGDFHLAGSAIRPMHGK